MLTKARLADSLALRAAHVLAKVTPGWAQRAVREPCFVVGCGRSGSTFLRKVLATHPRLAVFPSEANRYWHPDLYPWNRRRIEAPPIWVDPSDFSRASGATWSSRRAAAIRALFGAFRAARGGQVLVIKSAMIHFMLPMILETFPGARFVHLVRDGRAVALSYAKRMGATHDEAARDFDKTLDTTSSYWQASMTEIDRQVEELGLDDTRFLEIRYEDLCLEPSTGLTAIAKFLAVEPTPLLESEVGAFRLMNYKFSAEVQPKTLERITDLMANGLAQKGYALEL